MPFSADNAPDHICLLRLSALGDITHVLPTLRTLQSHWPATRISWIIGKNEYQLVKDITGVDFILFDKSAGNAALHKLSRDVRTQLKDAGHKRFDILFHMQISLRASIASMFIPAKIKLGFDRARAKDMQAMFCNEKIEPASIRQHVLDSFLEFPKHFGLEPVMQWNLPVSEQARKNVVGMINTNRSDPPGDLFVINPCAVAKSKNWRNWTDEGYAAVADFIEQHAGMKVVLSGGPSEIERDTADRILERCQYAQPVNLVGKTSIDELVALLDSAEIVLAPDTGPVHIASSLGTNTIGLYASTNPLRAGPYRFMEHVVNQYPQALAQYHDTTVEQARWGKRIKTAECMQLITVDQVLGQVNRLITG